jgi:hypothetical protein
MSFFAPAEHIASLIAELHQAVRQRTSKGAGIPHTRPMLRDYAHGGNMLQVYHLEPSDDLQLVTNALEQLVSLHPMLRSVHQPKVFWIRELARYVLDEEILPSRDAFQTSDFIRLPLDLSKEVFRARLSWVDGEGAAFLSLSVHHIVLDGPSQQILYGNLLQLLWAERAGQSAELQPYDAEKVACDAITEHVRTRGIQFTIPELPVDSLQVQVPFELPNPSAAFSMQIMVIHVPDQTIESATRIANSSGLTRNALFLGSLAYLLHKHSGQNSFAISQTYHGRKHDQLHAIGSFSTPMPMQFRFEAGSSMLSICLGALQDTQRLLNLEALIYTWNESLIPPVAYELTDLRPIPRYAEGNEPGGIELVGAFFTVNQFADGYSVNVSYNTERYDGRRISTFVTKWMNLWVVGLQP